jgi:hypothetical protein
MKQEANNHQKKIDQLVEILSKSEGLGEDPDSSEALDFLGLAEGGELIHYEALMK